MCAVIIVVQEVLLLLIYYYFSLNLDIATSILKEICIMMSLKMCVYAV